ncbi:hypothetical protein [Nannocystis sp.]|uniref:hypothetical protein n=1 Tax=Nannocystis sp. TaxID=1962667 RepID=UPI002427904C|nr:hypothetical protein [Nannocystis sp.]MBK7824032.1 hypothetical protein [Nannocystis sp.]MBK9755047.1 hypothetical protein [Nannocystis sp.]
MVLPTRRCLLAALLAAACGVPDGSVHLNLVPGDGTQVIHTPLQLAVRITGPELDLVRGEQLLARSSDAPGEPLRFTLDGQRLELVLGATTSDTNCDLQDPLNARSAVRCRDLTWTSATLRSPDGPVPGTTPTLRGAAPRGFLGAALPGLPAGVIVGLLLARSIGVALLLALLVLLAAVPIGQRFEELFAVTHGLAFVACAALGLFAAIAWHDNSRLAGIVLALATTVGPCAVVVAYPLWGEAGPLIAVAAAVPAIAVLALLGLGLTTLLGDAHPTSRWLLRSAGDDRR